MSAWKITKGILGAQAIMAVIGALIFFGVGLVATRNEKPKQKLTKDGFKTAEMQKIYNRYINKEMKYGES
jgi:predicted ATPase